MPEAAIRTPRQRWARPGGAHDALVKTLRILLPATVGILGAILALSPLGSRGDVSFVLAKDSVAIARERMRVTAATYRGEDGKGQPFTISAGSAVQLTSRDPVVRMNDLAAQIQMPDGPAKIVADAGRYDMNKQVVNVDGPLRFTAADGYSLQTRDVAIGLQSRKVVSGGAVDGSIPIGRFSADQMRADLGARTVTLDGRARLHIDQRRAK